MNDPILFNPDNRLLGGATGDLSLYGGQSDPKFSIQPARDGAPSSQEPAAGSVPGTVSASAPTSDLAAPISNSVTDYSADSGAGMLAPSAFLITSPQATFEPVVTTAPATGTGQVMSDWNPAPHGAGSPIPVLNQADATAPSDGSDATAPSVAIDAVADNAAAMLDGVVGTAGLVTGTAAALLDELADVPAAVSTVISPIADTVGSTLETTIGAVDDTLEGLAGSDPLGGVATLVNLVSVSDMFDLNAVDVPLADAAGDSGLGVLDALVGEELLPDTLLGAHHDDGLLGSGDHDQPLGL
jgi:hypothetical protein